MVLSIVLRAGEIPTSSGKPQVHMTPVRTIFSARDQFSPNLLYPYLMIVLANTLPSCPNPLQVRPQQIPTQHGQPTMHSTMANRQGVQWQVRLQEPLQQQHQGTRVQHYRPLGGSQITQRLGKSTIRRWP